MWRDYFRFAALTEGASLFSARGPRGRDDVAWRDDPAAFASWAEGRTGVALCDASQRELRATGWTSNRARQNVASYLAKTLRLDWRLGAAWYEHWLVDYDAPSNWGNWAYAAGVGLDPREDRVFNLAKQARDYDPEGRYRAHWLGGVAVG